MGIITAILLFIIGSVGAACHGDLSGFGAIAKLIGFIALFGCLAFLMINPVLLIIVVIILVIIIICCSK